MSESKDKELVQTVEPRQFPRFNFRSKKAALICIYLLFTIVIVGVVWLKVIEKPSVKTGRSIGECSQQIADSKAAINNKNYAEAVAKLEDTKKRCNTETIPDQPADEKMRLDLLSYHTGYAQAAYSNGDNETAKAEAGKAIEVGKKMSQVEKDSNPEAREDVILMFRIMNEGVKKQ